MVFKIKETRHFNSSGKVFSAPVISRKLNGYIVVNEEGNNVFVCTDDIDIISISDSERKMAIEF